LRRHLLLRLLLHQRRDLLPCPPDHDRHVEREEGVGGRRRKKQSSHCLEHHLHHSELAHDLCFGHWEQLLCLGLQLTGSQSVESSSQHRHSEDRRNQARQEVCFSHQPLSKYLHSEGKKKRINWHLKPFWRRHFACKCCRRHGSQLLKRFAATGGFNWLVRWMLSPIHSNSMVAKG
jgi:hypothetical protein